METFVSIRDVVYLIILQNKSWNITRIGEKVDLHVLLLLYRKLILEKVSYLSIKCVFWVYQDFLNNRFVYAI